MSNDRSIGLVVTVCLTFAFSAAGCGPAPDDDLGPLAAPFAVTGGRGSPVPDVFTPLVASPVASPYPVLASDGQRHLVYELHLTGTAGATVTLAKVQTLDADTDQVLATLEGASLEDAGAQGSPVTLNPGGSSYLFMHLPRPPGTRVPARLVHQFTVTLAPDLPLVAREFRSGATGVTAEAAVVIGPPLVGRRWISVNGCCDPTGHRGALLPVNGGLYLAQRFAIDFVQLDADGRLFSGPPDVLASYPFYGTAVLSVAAGVVVRVKDGMPDNIPGSLPADLNPDYAGGNHVVVDIGGGRFAFYAHLKPGSIKVALGDRVGRGRPLALLGNSGNSSGPHLHFQVMDGPSPLGSDGLPFVFRSFRSEGTVNNGDDVLAGAAATFDPALRGVHVDKLPLDIQSVDF